MKSSLEHLQAGDRHGYYRRQAARAGRAALLISVLASGLPPALAQQAPPQQSAVPPGALQPGTAGTLMDNGQAARMIGGYWRVYWDGEQANPGVLQVTGVNVADNQFTFSGQYSADGLNTCEAIGTWVYVTKAYYRSGGTVYQVDQRNFVRMRLNCPGRPIEMEFISTPNGTSGQLSGRASFDQDRAQRMVPVVLQRFSSRL